MTFTYPAKAMRDGVSRTVPAYKTGIPGLVITYGFDAQGPTNKLWAITLEHTGLILNAHYKIKTRKQARMLTAVLGALHTDWQDVEGAAKAIESKGFKEWYLRAIQ